MDEQMLEAHVAFEVSAWTESLDETFGLQVGVILEWLDSVSLGSVLSDADLDAVIETLPVPDLTMSILAALDSALADGTPIGDLIEREQYDRAAQALAGMTDLQETIVEQITTSTVYADLISHVLLQGIRNYVTVESPIARVPGASSLMKIGQTAFDNAAPRLSKGIEKQLTSFVSANLQDTLRESRTYLTKVVDEAALQEVAADVWERNADTPLADIAALLPQDTAVELAAVAQEALATLLTTPSFRDAAHRVLQANAARPVGEVLAEAGITADTIVAQARPWILRAADDGILEEIVRQRLTSFYENY